MDTEATLDSQLSPPTTADLTAMDTQEPADTPTKTTETKETGDTTQQTDTNAAKHVNSPPEANHEPTATPPGQEATRSNNTEKNDTEKNDTETLPEEGDTDDTLVGSGQEHESYGAMGDSEWETLTTRKRGIRSPKRRPKTDKKRPKRDVVVSMGKNRATTKTTR